MAALWLARTGVRTLVVDRNSGPTEAGHADGLESRTLEILDSFGLGQKIWNESNHTIDICLWVRNLTDYIRSIPTKVGDFRKGLPTDLCNDKAFRRTQSRDGRGSKSPRWGSLELRLFWQKRCLDLVTSR